MAQSKQVKDKYFDNDTVNFYDNYELSHGYFALFEHFHYFDNIDLSGVAKGVKFSLAKHIEFWKHIGASQFILKTITEGYVIPFLGTPPPMKFKNNQSALKHSDFVDLSISELLKEGCIHQVPFQPFVVNPLSVAVQKSGKKRLILDLSELNYYIKKNKVKFEDYKIALNYFHKNCYMYKFDLRSGYFHLDINKKQQTYLGFSWKGKFYCFSVLAFGLSSAPYIFTKCLRPMVKYWRENGMNIVLYLDDGLGLENDYVKCKNNSDFVKSSLKLAGFLVNESKSIFEPIQCLEWLGLIWDSKNFSINIPDRRISEALTSLESIMEKFPKFSARQLAQFTGKIISMSPVMGNVTSLMTRHLYFTIENRKRWDDIVNITLPQCLMAELKFWQENISFLNKKCFIEFDIPKILIYSDASNYAAGACMVKLNDRIFHQMWDECEMSMSSTWRELRAVQLALHSYLSDLKNKTIKWHTDNQNCVSIINKGSTKMHLQHLAYDIFKTCSKHGITLIPTWVPRSENCKADFLSKIIDVEDWETSLSFFSYMDTLWGPHTIDRFANYRNKKTDRFNSRFWNPGSEAVDAFSQNWKTDNNWLVPPISLVAKSILHCIMCKANGTLIVPKWPSSSFWTLIFKRNLEYQPYVIDVLEFSPNQNIFIHGSNKNALLGAPDFSSEILAIRLRAC